MIPTIITQIANGKKQIELGSTHPTRDFSYVSDTVAGFSAALRSDKGVGEMINLGTNHEVSIGDVAQIIADIMCIEISIVTDDKRCRPEKSEVERLRASNVKAFSLLGWQPEFRSSGGLRRGLEETVDWFKRPENLEKYKSTIYNL